MLALGSALLFWLALRNFKPELKQAYRLLAFSTIAVGVGLLIFPYIEYYGLWDNLLLNMSSYLQYLIGAPLMYFGVRTFYKKVGLTGKEASIAAVIIGIIVVSLIHPFLPYDNSWPLPRWQYDLFKVVAIIPFIMYAAAGVMALRIRQQAGSEYRPAFTWLVIAMAFYVINTLGIILIEVIGYENVYYAERIYTVPAILGDLCLVFAGYSFTAIGLPKVVHGSSAKTTTSVDIILYVAGKASNQTMIDDHLDDLRTITSHVKPGEALSPEDEVVLKDTYLGIENFLTTNDPLRNFDRNTLRADIAQHFQLDGNANTTFWASL